MKKRYWTQKEINFIKENLGTMKVPTMAQHLNRTETAVLLKMKRLGLSNTKSFTGQLTMHELSNLLKIDSKSVNLWMKNHGLKFTKKATRNTKQFYFIKPEDFWDWALHNKERVDFSKIEPNAIVPEPEFVREERGNSKSTNYKSWTTKEINIMFGLISSGNTFSDVGKRLDRSSTSIEKKYYRLNKNKQLIRKKSQ